MKKILLFLVLLIGLSDLQGQSISVTDQQFACFFGEVFTLNGTRNGRNLYSFAAFDIEWTGTQWQIRSGANVFVTCTADASPNPPSTSDAVANGTPWTKGPACTSTGPFIIVGDGTITTIGGGCTDAAPPTISCPSNVTQSNDAGECEADVTYTAATAADDCTAMPAITYSQNSGTAFSVGTTTVTATVTDDASNTATCSFNVTVNDTEDPSITCPSNVDVDNDAGDCAAVVTYNAASATDNCDMMVDITYSQNSGTSFNVGSTTVTATATDDESNTATCSFSVTVNDTENPTANCPGTQTVGNDAGQCGANVNFSIPNPTDNCPGATSTENLASGSFFNVGTTIVTVTATDASANQSTCTFNVVVNDVQNPTITCPSVPGTATFSFRLFPDSAPGEITWELRDPGNNVVGSGGPYPSATPFVPFDENVTVNCNTTYTFNIFDSGGNGMTTPGGYTLLVDGGVVYSDGPGGFGGAMETQMVMIPNCPGAVNFTADNDAGNCSAVVNGLLATATDDCTASPTISHTISGATSGSGGADASGTFNVGTSMVTFTATDDASNTATCSFNVTVNDTEDPSITCPSNVDVDNDSGDCTAVVNYNPATATDNCDMMVDITYSQNSGTSFNVGSTTVTATATDDESNTATCSFSVTVNDNEDPSITCPSNVDVDNDTGDCAAVVTYDPATATDNCDMMVDITYSQNSGTSFNVGSTTVTATATDDESNTATCSFSVTVNDNEDPSITCPSNVDVDNDTGDCAAVVTYNAATAMDNCDMMVDITYSQNSGTSFNVGSTTVTATATDDATNTATCTFSVTVNDTEDPSITCPSNVEVDNDAGDCAAVVTYDPATATDNCDMMVDIMYSQNSGTSFNVGSTTVTATATDDETNTATCTFSVTVNDNEDPTISCPSNVNQGVDMGETFATVTGIAPTASNDNCAPPSITIITYAITGVTTGSAATDASNTTFNIGMSTVTYTITDASSNTATCSFSVTITDVQPEIGVSFMGTNIADGDNMPTAAKGTDFGSLDIDGGTPVTRTFTIHNTGNEDLILTGGNPVSISGLNASAFTVTEQPLTNIIQPMGSINFTVSFDPLNDQCGNLEATIMIASNDADENPYDIDIAGEGVDNIDPSVTCPMNITESNDAGQCGAVVTFAATATDNCDVNQPDLVGGQGTARTTFSFDGPPSSVSTSASPASGELFDVGTTVVTVTAEDAAGNTATCTFSVTVNDTEAPSITCPSNVDVDNDAGDCAAVVNYDPATATDNCDMMVDIMYSQNSGTSFDVGSTTVTATATDDETNTSTCTFSVTVNDTENPSITCPSNVDVDNDAGECAAMVTYNAATATDNCDMMVDIMYSQNSGTSFDVGSTTVTATATDDATNTATCTFSITVNDVEPPSAVCPNDINVNAPQGACGANIAYAGPLVSDACGIADMGGVVCSPASGSFFDVGSTQITCTVTDVNGNTNTCSFNININDNEAPSITCPSNVEVDNDAGDCSAVATYDPATATDNCDMMVDIMYSQNSGTSFDVGSTTVTATATDDETNTSTCTFSVTVNDAESPTVTCPMNITQDTDPGGCTAVVSYSTPSGADNCPGHTVAAVPSSGSSFNLGTTTVTVTATDASGNQGTCTFNVTVEDNTTCGCDMPQPGDVCDDMNPATINDMIQDDCSCMGIIPCDIEITSVDVSDETCAGDNDGSITINATCTTCDGILYSIDGGMTTQSSPTFTGLSPDTYQPFVVDSGDNTCDDTDMDATVNMGAPLPADPVAVQMSSEFCSNSGVGNANKRVRIEEPAGANEGTIWILTDAPTGSQFDGMEPIEFAEGDSNSEFRVTGGSKGNTVTMRGEPDNNGTPVYGTWTFDVRVEDSNTGCTSGTETGYFITAFENPADPVAEIATKSLCVNPDLSPSLTNSGVKVMNDLTADERVVWVLTSAPAGSAFAANDEFTIDNCGDPFNNYGELAVAFSSKVIRIQDIENAPVGTYTFDTYIENCATGCISGTTSGFSITVNAAPSVMITADPEGDLCLGQEDVQYNAVVTSTDGGTYSYLWCAYNSGDGSGTCFNGFDNNTAQDPMRDWTSSAGNKSVGVTATSDVAGCEAEDLYSFEVVAPTMVECPDDIMATLETDPMTFDCTTDITFNHPMVEAGACDPVNLTLEITGPSGAGPEMVTPGEEYVFSVVELGEYTVTYNLSDAVGNTSSCSFKITVDGLLCGWVDNGGIGDCAGENGSDYDPETETYMVSSNGCVPAFPYTVDNQGFINTQLCGDGYIEVFVDNITAKGFAGISLRESQAPGAKKVEIGTDNVARIIRAARVIDGYPAFPQELISFDKFWLKIERTGNSFRASASTDGVSYTPYLFQTIMMGECLEAGLWAYSTNPEDVVTATFNNVTVVEYGGAGLQAPVTNLAQSQTDLGAFDVSLTPNPAKEQVTLNLEQLIGQEVMIRLYNINGQLMQQQPIEAVGTATHRLDLSNLPQGAYWVQVQSASGQKTMKLIKQ